MHVLVVGAAICAALYFAIRLAVRLYFPPET